MKLMRQKLKEFINNLYIKYFNKLMLDDVLHSYVSTIICIIFFIVGCKLGNYWLSAGISIVLTFLIGYFKEYIIDKKIRVTAFSKRDLISDMIGIGIGTIINIAFILI